MRLLTIAAVLLAVGGCETHDFDPEPFSQCVQPALDSLEEHWLVLCHDIDATEAVWERLVAKCRYAAGIDFQEELLQCVDDQLSGKAE